jgi:SAM-dependent methyltransferase
LALLRNDVVYALPERARGGLARALPSRVLPPEMRPDFFDRLYECDEDPFGFDSQPEENLKFDRTLELCGPGPFDHVLEIGCSEGALTELLYPIAKSVLAIDVSSAAVERATLRFRDVPNVRVERRAFPSQLPTGEFDLVVASDVLYYLDLPKLRSSLQAVENALRPGGAFVAVHYVPRMGSVLNGDETHDELLRRTTLAHVHGERTEFGPGRPYRLDRFERPSPE